VRPSCIATRLADSRSKFTNRGNRRARGLITGAAASITSCGGSRPAERLRERRFDWVAAAAWALVLAALCVQLRIGRLVWGSDLVGADDPAHFTTGVMVYEYFRHALFSNPMEFARSFYIRFPKVALGHWPPVYYVLQALLYAVARPSIEAARALSAAIALAVAWMLFTRARRLHGTTIGALCAASFLVLPPVQGAAWLVMSDLLVSLFMFLAAMSFADFLDSGRPRHTVWFVLWSTLAILTKGNGAALGIFALFAPVFAGRLSCFRSKWFWISGIAAGVLTAPFYLWTQRLHVAYPADTAALAQGALHITRRFLILSSLPGFLPPLVFLIALTGIALAWFRGTNSSEAAALALILSQVVFLLILPLTKESRYFMPSAAAIMLLYARGMTVFGRRLGPVAIAAACFAVCGLSQVDRVDGYRPAVDSIPYSSQGAVILVASDAPGEGAIVAERLEHDHALAGLVLRGSKVVAESTWSGSGYRLILRDPAEALDYLQSVPVRYVVIDRSAARNPHRDLIEKTMLSAPEVFPLRGRFLIAGARSGEILVFENLRAAGRPAVIHLRIASRTVEYSAEPAKEQEIKPPVIRQR